MIAIIDNYDSFTYNLVQYVGEILGRQNAISVYRNDELGVDELLEQHPRAIIISPGPCTPLEAGISLNLIRTAAGRIPLLGVCLGHQAIVQAFGGKIVRGTQPMHGKTSAIHHTNENIFYGIENPFIAARYHSLIADAPSLPPALRVLATSDDDVIMSVTHRDFPNLIGVQFHPESVFTTVGKPLLAAFFRQHVAEVS